MKRLKLLAASLALALLTVFVASPALGAVALDNKDSRNGSGASESWTYTPTSNTPTLALFAITAFGGGIFTAINNAQYGSGQPVFVASDTHGHSTTYLYALCGPPPGPQTVSVTLSSGFNHQVEVLTFTGTPRDCSALGTPVTTNGSTTPSSISVTTATGHMIFATTGLFVSLGTPSITFNQTQQYNVPQASSYIVGGQTATGTGSISMSATLGGTVSDVMSVGVDILPASTGTNTAGVSSIPNPTYAGREAWCWGESIANGTINNAQDTTNGWCYKVAADEKLSMTQRAVNGSSSDWHAAFEIMGLVVRPGMVSFGDFGDDDYLFYPTGAAADLGTFRNLIQGAIAWLAIPEQGKIYASSAAVTKGGTWGAGNPTWYNAANGSASQTNQGTTTVNSTLTATVSGTAVYIWYANWKNTNNGGVFTVTVDGVLLATVDTNGGRATAVSQAGITYRPEFVRIGGLQPGPHTVVAKATTADASHLVYIDAFASPTSWTASSSPGTAAGPQVFLANGERVASATYATYSTTEAVANQYKDVLTSVARLLSSDGLRVALVDTTNFYDPNSSNCGVSPDGLHPTICGHARIADAFEKEMNLAANGGRFNAAWSAITGYPPYNVGPGGVATTAAFTLTLADDVRLVDPTSGSFNVTLPSAVGLNGKWFSLINVRTSGTNTVTWLPNGSETINGASSYVFTQAGQLATIASDGANWRILNQYLPFQIDGVASLTSQVVASNTSADTTILTYSVGANTSFAGTVYRFKAAGNTDNTTTSGTINIWIKNNAGTKIATLSVVTTTSAQTVKPWWVDFYVTIRTIGAGGTEISAGTGYSSQGTGVAVANFPIVDNTSTTAMDTTAAHTFTLGMNWTAAVSGNILRADHAVITREKL